MNNEPSKTPPHGPSKTPPPAPAARRVWWPWLVLALGLVWTVLVRVPLVLNAEDHLDSDLAVDGLTLIDALHGHWRWHYPGTPHMGILPLFASYFQARIWGAGPIALVSGGTVLWALVVAAAFVLAWKALGPAAAGWAIVPLVFSSRGTIWLSGRITGGHLATLAWHLAALAGLCSCLQRGGWKRAAGLGLWCGLGLYLDAMFLFTIAGMALAAGLAWLTTGRTPVETRNLLAFLAAFAVGLAPLGIGRGVDPYDAYPSQFSATLDQTALLEHARLFAIHCLPRLIAGPELRAEGRVLSSSAEWAPALVVLGSLAAVFFLVLEAVRSKIAARRAALVAAMASAALIVGAFLVNKNIYNSDNYRYLIFLLAPWSLGFGAAMARLTKMGPRGRCAALAIAAALAAFSTATTWTWYRHTRHYLNERGALVRRDFAPWSELMVGRPARRFAVPKRVAHVFGDYWDVYRLAFLSGKRIMGVPYPTHPNRFQGWSAGLGSGPGTGTLLVLGPRRGAPGAGASAGATVPADEPGGRRIVVPSALGLRWRTAFRTVWKADGRDPAEIARLRVVVP